MALVSSVATVGPLSPRGGEVKLANETLMDKAFLGRVAYSKLGELGENKFFHDLSNAIGVFDSGALWSATAYVARDLHLLQKTLEGHSFTVPRYVARAKAMREKYVAMLEERRSASLASANAMRDGTHWAKGIGYGVDTGEDSTEPYDGSSSENLTRARKFGVLARVMELSLKTVLSNPAALLQHPFLKANVAATLGQSSFIPAGLAILREAVDDEALKGDDIPVRGSTAFMHTLHMCVNTPWLHSALVAHKSVITHALKHCKVAVTDIAMEGVELDEEGTKHFKKLKTKIDKMHDDMKSFFEKVTKPSSPSDDASSIGTLEEKEGEVKDNGEEKAYEAVMEQYTFRKGEVKSKFASGTDSPLPRAALARIGKELRSLKRTLPLNYGSSVLLVYDGKKPQYMRAAITGPEGTPYDSGFFLFDVHCDSSFPSGPPKCNILTTGSGSFTFNPNLYACGKVCLSLLGTWSGGQEEMWHEARSTLLQLFVSIQALILVPEPYRNEPGYETATKEDVRTSSYCGIFPIRVATVKFAMLEHLKNPPAGFEDAARDHFRLKKGYIINTCESWLKEAKEGMENAESDKKARYEEHIAALEPLVKELKGELEKLEAGGKSEEGETKEQEE